MLGTFFSTYTDKIKMARFPNATKNTKYSVQISRQEEEKHIAGVRSGHITYLALWGSEDPRCPAPSEQWREKKKHASNKHDPNNEDNRLILEVTRELGYNGCTRDQIICEVMNRASREGITMSRKDVSDRLREMHLQKLVVRQD